MAEKKSAKSVKSNTDPETGKYLDTTSVGESVETPFKSTDPRSKKNAPELPADDTDSA